jgi:MFS family permease
MPMRVSDRTSAAPAQTAARQEVTRLRDLSPRQWKSGLAAWLGWLFDGLDMHLYVLVAVPFVSELLGPVEDRGEKAKDYSSLIQAAFLVGWALGGGFFGRVGDRLGRSRALMLTILTYALFTGLSTIAQTWWQLLILRFLAALGIGGEWAVGSSLLSETWPRRWGPWLAAILQTAVCLGVMLASLANLLMARVPNRYLFLVGVLPALLVLWIRRAVPETEEWQGARRLSAEAVPGFLDLFRGPVRRTTILTVLVCSLALTAHWAFVFWFPQHVGQLPEVKALSEDGQREFKSQAVLLVTLASIVGNFVAGLLARWLNYRRAVACLCLGYFLAVWGTYGVPRAYASLLPGAILIGLCQGIFALFTMYLPPLFPTLLRTTGAGFCYNIGRIASGAGLVVFGLLAPVGDYRVAILYAGTLFVPAAAVAWLMPDPPGEKS